MNGAVYRKNASPIMTGTKVQTSPKIRRFLALFGSLSLFTAHAIIPPIIPKKSGTRYQAALTCCTGFHGAAVAAVAATPLAGAPQFGQNTALSAISLPQLWQNIADTHGLSLVKCPEYSAIYDHLANSEVEGSCLEGSFFSNRMVM